METSQWRAIENVQTHNFSIIPLHPVTRDSFNGQFLWRPSVSVPEYCTICETESGVRWSSWRAQLLTYIKHSALYLKRANMKMLSFPRVHGATQQAASGFWKLFFSLLSLSLVVLKRGSSLSLPLSFSVVCTHTHTQLSTWERASHGLLQLVFLTNATLQRREGETWHAIKLSWFSRFESLHSLLCSTLPSLSFSLSFFAPLPRSLARPPCLLLPTLSFLFSFLAALTWTRAVLWEYGPF